MNSLTEEELDSLPLKELVQRMDDFLLKSNEERYGKLPDGFTIHLPSELVNTIVVQKRQELEIRKIAYLVFSYLVQLEQSSVSSGFANEILFPKGFKPIDWASPTLRLRFGAINQYQIICSRIAFEIFIDLLHTIETGERLNTNKSKLKPFRKWLKDVNNKFHYFAHVLLIAYRFDREVRTPKVHGSSTSPRNMLLLQTPSNEEINKQFRLTNTLAGVWKPLIDILNDIRPTYMQMSQADEDWFQAYMSGDDDAIEAKLDEMLSSID
jgi:hypothetical protein